MPADPKGAFAGELNSAGGLGGYYYYYSQLLLSNLINTLSYQKENL
jgi:hypothetical protein